MAGLNNFTTHVFHPRTIVTKASAYTVTLADEFVRINGTVTMTLPVINTMQGTTNHRKAYKFENVHATLIGTVAPGAGNTISGRNAINLQPGESIVISASEVDTKWEIISPSTLAPGVRNFVTLVADTSGTTPIHFVDSAGCPVVGTIVDITAVALDTNAGNITVKNSTDTVCAFAKSTTAGALTGATTLTTPQCAVDSVLTVESSSTNGNGRVRLILSTQNVIK